MSWSRALAIALLFASCAADTSARAEGQARIQLPVGVCGVDHVPAAVLAEAMRVAGDAYGDIGVTIDWSGDRCDGDLLTVRLTSSPDAGIDTPGDTLGFAEPGTSLAVVMYDRIEKFARKYHVGRQLVLGYSMAHELGHLLLPRNSHSITGLMRASLNMDLAAARQLRFTPAQGMVIVRRLTAVVATN